MLPKKFAALAVQMRAVAAAIGKTTWLLTWAKWFSVGQS